MQHTTFVSIVLAIISSTTFSFYCGIRTVRLVGQRTLNFVKQAGQTSPCSSSSPFALNQICIERSESGPQNKLRQSARNNPSKLTHLRRAMRMYAIPTSYDSECMWLFRKNICLVFRMNPPLYICNIRFMVRGAGNEWKSCAV